VTFSCLRLALPFKTTPLTSPFLFPFLPQAVKNGDANPPLPPHPKLHSQWEERTGHKIGDTSALSARLADYGGKLVKAVQDMPHNSPIRRSLLAIVSEDQPANVVAQDFKVSLTTVYAARREENNFALNLAYTPGVKRRRIEEKQKS